MSDKTDWYSYLTLDFKLAREAYTVNDRAVFTCPQCTTTSVVRINHVKEKIKKLGSYVCGTCRKRDSVKRARAACHEKYGGKNPFSIDEVRAKIRETLLKLHGVENMLLNPRIQELGRAKAAQVHKTRVRGAYKI
jgi:transposase-like protein